MKKSWTIGAALLALTVCRANAQTRKADKAAAVVNDKATVAADKADLNRLRDEKADDKLQGDQPAVKADRKAIRKTEGRLMKDRAKTGVDKVKKVI